MTMQIELTRKGALYAADCRKCGASLYAHEWAHWNNNEARDMLRDGTYACDQCATGTADPETFTECGRQYAARYSMPGYLDCTDWSFGPNRRVLLREIRDMYGED